ncbi:MAG: hypothetical protein ACRYFR_14295 [Janthinobacterium lividum]
MTREINKRSRSLLHVNDLKEFANYLISKGYALLPIVSDYEVLRVSSTKGINSVYTRAATSRGNTPVHLTVHGYVFEEAVNFYSQKSKAIADAL